MRANDIGHWAVVYLGVISTLLGASYLRPWLGGNAVVTLAFAGATLLVLAGRRAELKHHALPTKPLAALMIGCGGIAGYASLRGLVTGTVATASLLGVVAPALPSSNVAWPVAPALLAPIFEEILHREQLFNLLRPRIGVVPTLLVTSAAFALPHVHPWLVAGAFLAGILLGTVVWMSGSLSLSIGLHLGWNMGSLAYAAYGPTLLPPPWVGVPIVLAICLVAWMVLRRVPRAECPR